MITVYHYMTVAAILFAMGTYGVLTRRNAIVIVLFVMAVAAAEAGVGLALMITFYRNRDSIDVDDINLMKL
jgi:NADH-quinone oxidoreductase subunit K